MDSDEADPDTRDEVNILILDYLSCIAIESILSGRIAEKEGLPVEQYDPGWLTSSVNCKHLLKSPQDHINE